MSKGGYEDIMYIGKSKDYSKLDFNKVNLQYILKKYSVKPKYFSLKNAKILENAINSLPKRCIAYLGSGDFHYLTYFLVKRLVEKPFLILFDNHFDSNKAPDGYITCGSWLRQCIDENLILGALVVGGNRKYYNNDLLYPFLYYIEDGNKLMNVKLIKKLRGKEFYISIDKDVLSEEVLKTNWDQGSMTLDSLIKWLKFFNRLGFVLGVDLCGENGYNPLLELINPNDSISHKRVNNEICKAFLN